MFESLLASTASSIGAVGAGTVTAPAVASGLGLSGMLSGLGSLLGPVGALAGAAGGLGGMFGSTDTGSAISGGTFTSGVFAPTIGGVPAWVWILAGVLALIWLMRK